MAAPKRPALILLVNGEPRNARVLARMLREDGYAVEVCAGQKEAMGRLAHEPMPDMLLADVRSPCDAEALSAARFGRDLRPDLPMVLVSAHAEQMKDLQRILAPPTRVMAKPTQYDALTAEIARMMKARPRRSRAGKVQP